MSDDPEFDKYEKAYDKLIEITDALGLQIDQDEVTAAVSLTVDQHKLLVDALDDFFSLACFHAIRLDTADREIKYLTDETYRESVDREVDQSFSIGKKDRD